MTSEKSELAILEAAVLANEAAVDFEGLALRIFRYQAQNNALYRDFLQHLRRAPEEITNFSQIPYLPISVFKHHAVQTETWAAARIFESSGTTSGTTGGDASRHLLKSENWYRILAAQGLQTQYGRAVSEFCVLALLPSYMERGGSSLVFMVDDFVQKSKHKESGFFLETRGKLAEILAENAALDRPTLFFGVSYALLDFARDFPQPLAPCIRIIETGGMKGRRKEISKTALHQTLQAAFSQAKIDSEYGMTELLSQAYMRNGRYFLPNPTMRVSLREVSDPFAAITLPNKTGGINVADLANLHTISFIATDDLGRFPNNAEAHAFEVLGRFDAADLRGCNLLVN
jgi:hypothetical protein